MPLCWVCTPETVYGIAYGFFGLRGMPEPAGELIQGAASPANPWKTARKLPEATGKTVRKLPANPWKTVRKLPEPLAKPLENRWKTG